MHFFTTDWIDKIETIDTDIFCIQNLPTVQGFSRQYKMIILPFLIFLQENIFDKLEFELVETSVKVRYK